MDIVDRLSPILSSIEYQLARSLPVLNRNGKEIVFFYKVNEIDNQRYTISEMKYIVFVDAKTGLIEKKQAADVLPNTMLKEITDAENCYMLDVEQELNAEDNYLTWYEVLLDSYIASGLVDELIQEKLNKILDLLTDGTCLKPIYQYLKSLI